MQTLLSCQVQADVYDPNALTTDKIDNPRLCNRGRDVDAVGTRAVATATTIAGAHKLAITGDGDLLTPQGDSLGECDGWRPS